jgi:hypothetical protein
VAFTSLVGQNTLIVEFKVSPIASHCSQYWRFVESTFKVPDITRDLSNEISSSSWFLNPLVFLFTLGFSWAYVRVPHILNKVIGPEVMHTSNMVEPFTSLVWLDTVDSLLNREILFHIFESKVDFVRRDASNSPIGLTALLIRR